MSTKPLFAASIAIAALLVPAAAHAQPPETQPGVTREVVAENATVTAETRISPPPNRYLLASGMAVFGISYGTSVIVGLMSGRGSDDNLYIPVVGPWIALGARDCDRDPCEAKGLSGVLLVADGLVQAAGVIAMGAAFFVPERGTTLQIGPSGPKMTVAPAKLGPAGYGVAAIGEF
jgi:hypothetical protein